MAQETSGRRDGRARGPLLVLLTLCAALVAVYAGRSHTGPPPGEWLTSFDAAIARAAEEDRPVLVAFSMVGCSVCTYMDRKVLSDSRVQEALEDFVGLRVDVSDEAELTRRLGIYATPTYVVLEPEGDVAARAQGYRSVEDFVSFLKRARQAPDGEAAGPPREDEP